MYKKLYNGRSIPDNHFDKSLITHDIVGNSFFWFCCNCLGAQPKGWFDNNRPFFREADANLHINNQRVQYIDSTNNELSIKQQYIFFFISKKITEYFCGYCEITNLGMTNTNMRKNTGQLTDTIMVEKLKKKDWYIINFFRMKSERQIRFFMQEISIMQILKVQNLEL